MSMFAHSLPGRPLEQWESLSEHLLAVSRHAELFGAVFGWGQAARAAGLLHDIGKASAAFQAYIKADAHGPARGPDHSTAGAREACRRYPGLLGVTLAGAIAGHHAGLPNGEELDRRLSPDHRIDPYSGWEPACGKLPTAVEMVCREFKAIEPRGFSASFLTRMLFSCLVDADSLATETFYAQAHGVAQDCPIATPLAVLRDRLRNHMRQFSDNSSAVDKVRADVLRHVVSRAAEPPGLFSLTVPTGGGKTLASLSFALEHAVLHGLQRVVYVIPFTSIIEQTAAVFRSAVGEADVLEHHASFDWSEQRDDDEGRDGVVKLRRAAENWDVPVVVTTAVQFFESLFAHRRSRCRKLHNLAGSVIVLDEAQTIPLPVLRPCLAALDELSRNYRATAVMCTATQPALRLQDDFPGGLDIPPARELAPDPPRLYAMLRRVQVEVLADKIPDATVAARFAEQTQMLCIVNSRAHACAVFEAISGLPGAVHLSTLMVPKHRRQVLAALRTRLQVGEPVRLVSTSLIEAGVDISFPEVWRAVAGLDAIAQAAGRCNRNGELSQGKVVVFEPLEAKPPQALKAFWQAAERVLPCHRDDLLEPAAIHAYFRELYFQKGPEALDAVAVAGQRGVLPALAERFRDQRFPFRSLGEAFRLIEDTMLPVVVPWDEEAKAVLARLAVADRPTRGDLRQLQQYTVSIPRVARAAWLAAGALHCVNPALGDGLLAFSDTAHYHAETGLRLEALGLRQVEQNIF